MEIKTSYVDFEDYDEKSKTYTALRRAIGFDKQLAHFAKGDKPLMEQALLDAGCGTGNYLVKYIGKIGSIRGSDFNKGMLNEAHANLQKKLAAEESQITAGRVVFSEDNIVDMVDIESESFDAICNNQVVHHLRPEKDFHDFRNATKEFFRVLRSGGRVVINCSPLENTAQGIWWAELVPKAMELWSHKVPIKEKMQEILEEAGFISVEFESLHDDILYDPNLYFDPNNFLDIDRFKRSDSTFSLCTPEELEEAVAKVRKMVDDGTLSEWFAKKEADRNKIGQTLNIYAVKP